MPQSREWRWRASSGPRQLLQLQVLGELGYREGGLTYYPEEDAVYTRSRVRVPLENAPNTGWYTIWDLPLMLNRLQHAARRQIVDLLLDRLTEGEPT